MSLISPKSPLKKIVIEGSQEAKLAGEYVIDVAEYSQYGENSGTVVHYYQLKHSTRLLHQPFQLSDLKGTVMGFAKRYVGIKKLIDSAKGNIDDVRFSVVSNRPVATTLEGSIRDIAAGQPVNSRFKKTLEKYTGFSGDALRSFCGVLGFWDDEGDFLAQESRLKVSLSRLVAGTVDPPQIDTLIALVANKAMPGLEDDGQQGVITREHVLERLGVHSERELFPAPREFEETQGYFRRDQHQALLETVISSTVPVIIHAGGGVGKSVVSQQLAESLPPGSLGIVYDCFGSGKYRNPSEPRHRHRDGLVQISNEMAQLGLCDPLIPQNTDLRDRLLRAFLARMQSTVSALRALNSEALLVVFIDAADNAEMAAEERGEDCFAGDLLSLQLPEGCRIVALCRTERVTLLKPPSYIKQVELFPFNERETLQHLRQRFPSVSEIDGLEFHRLTNGNPRVQANALSGDRATVGEMLHSLGPTGTTVEAQIAAQLDAAIEGIRDRTSARFRGRVDAICQGLANLNPYIPLVVLARAAEVEVGEVRSFVADLGRPLWISENSVHFRDEPTETWFRSQFAASEEQLGGYTDRLKPLASELTYVAELLPYLMLRSGQLDQLVELALSEDYLPSNPIDEKNVRVARLQFALKAALRRKRYADSAKLAMRAGEETAGERRQLGLMKAHVDLVAPLQSQQRVQELAFRRMLQGGWMGSENLYSAALLSSVEDLKGEARGFYRSARNWLKVYFEERDKEDQNHQQEKLTEQDVLELVFTELNLSGPNEAVAYLIRWSPPEVIYSATKGLVQRLVDWGSFDLIESITTHARDNPYVMLALTSELLRVGRTPSRESLGKCLDILTQDSSRIPDQHDSGHYKRSSGMSSAIAAFAEACAIQKLPARKILSFIRLYLPQEANNSTGSDFAERERHVFFRGVSLIAALSNRVNPKPERWFPKNWKKKQKERWEIEDKDKFIHAANCLLPHYLLRAQTLLGNTTNVAAALTSADKEAREALSRGHRLNDRLPFEVGVVRFEILLLLGQRDEALEEYVANSLVDGRFRLSLDDGLSALRAAYRLDRLAAYKDGLEGYCRGFVFAEISYDESPEDKAGEFVRLSRAVLVADKAEAASYFTKAVEAASRFGDELVDRWGAAVSLTERTAEAQPESSEMAYRFIRCAELVGESVYREKYWNRNTAIEVCSKLHAPSAFAALSRWRDRHVGWLERQLPALVSQCLESKTLSPEAAWSLSAFKHDEGVFDFAVKCMAAAKDPVHRQRIFDTVVRDYRVRGMAVGERFAEAAQRFSLEQAEIQEAVEFYTAHAEEQRQQEKKRNAWLATSAEEPQKPDLDWEALFQALDLASPDGLAEALRRFRASPDRYGRERFWRNLFTRVAEPSRFLLALTETPAVDFYDTKEALACLPENYHRKVSVQEALPSVFNRFGQRFFPMLSHWWNWDYVFERLPGRKDLEASVREGILQGHVNTTTPVGPGELFGLVDSLAAFISPEEAREVLDFSLSRFERHMGAGFSDGPWGGWLEPPADPTDALTGFLWSALGSPRSAIRWQAAHAVRRLAELGCQAELDALVGWLNKDAVGAFGARDFPFYNLHARLYLLIAFARVSLDQPELLRPHSEILVQHALHGIDHILIQNFAARAALAVEAAFPGTYTAEVAQQLRNVGVSQFPRERAIEYRDSSKTSPWHVRGELDGISERDVYLAYDFDRYWSEPLGAVFGIPSGQVEELVAKVWMKDWKLLEKGRPPTDPRKHLWEQTYNRQETWHDHGSYPRTDDYAFYLSYHGLMAVAAQLLRNMPIVSSFYSPEEDTWAEWMKGHDITCADGFWLADHRDPVPLEKPSWTADTDSGSWLKKIQAEDFLRGLVAEPDGGMWVRVDGVWRICDYSREEEIRVSSALVSPETSQALLNSLSTYLNHHDFRLPEFRDEMEIDQSPFTLKGWIWRGDVSKRLDEHDPHAGTISHPPYSIGGEIAARLGLRSDRIGKNWYIADFTAPWLRSSSWSLDESERESAPDNSGIRLVASLELLQRLCETLGVEVIFEVEIRRRLTERSGRSKDIDEYRPPINKIFILEADGTLRDTATCYQLRPGAG